MTPVIDRATQIPSPNAPRTDDTTMSHPQDPTPMAGYPAPFLPPPPLRSPARIPKIVFIVATIAAAVTAPYAFMTTRNGISHIMDADSIHAYTGEPKDSIIFWNAFSLILFSLPFILCVTLAVIFGCKWQRRRTKSITPVRERVASHVRDLLSAIFSGEGLLSLLSFGLSLGALYTLLGLGSSFATEEEAMEAFASDFLMPVDFVLMAWAIPSLIIGIIAFRSAYSLGGVALTATIISVACVILSFTRIGMILPVFTRSLRQVFEQL